MTNLDGHENNDDSFNASDILQSPIKSEMSESADVDDYLKMLGIDNDADNNQKPEESSHLGNDNNSDDGTGLPSFLQDSNDDHQDQVPQEQPEEWTLPPEQDQFDLDNLDDQGQQPIEDLVQTDNLDQQQYNEQTDDLHQQENIYQQENIDQTENNEQYDNLEQQDHIDQNKEENLPNDEDEIGLPEIEVNDDNASANGQSEDQIQNSGDSNNNSDDSVDITNQTPQKAQTAQSPGGSKSKQKETKSFQEFLERNNNCFQRHYDKSVERPPSPHTIRYRNTGKVQPKFHSPEAKKLREKCQTERINQLFEASIRKGPCNSNYPPKTGDANNNNTTQNATSDSINSPKQSNNVNNQNTIMSEASTTLANSKSDRIIDLTVGKKSNLTKSQVYGILRKFYIKNEKDRSEILKNCGGDDEESKNQDQENNDNNENNENNSNENENNDENKTYSAESLKTILKQAASSEGGDSFIKKIRPIVKAAIFDMKQPIVSPMTQKQRAAMKFDETLRTSLRKPSPKQ